MIVRKQNEENSCRERNFWPMANLILRILIVRMKKAHQKRHVGGLKKEQMSTKEIESYLHS